MPEEERNFFALTLPFGPQHPASGHFQARYSVVGETVTDMVTDPGYLHRGFEKLMEYRNHEQNAMLVDRICILDPLSNEMGYACAVEKAAGLEAPPRARYIRTMMAELGRILSHVTWIGVLSMVLGLESGRNIAWGDREKIIRLNEILGGGRIYPLYFVPGGVRRDMPDGFREKIVEAVDYIEKQLDLYDNLVFNNPTVVARTRGVGVLKASDAMDMGVTGPSLRASGIDTDVRKDEPYDAYGEVKFNVITGKEGDAYSRCLCRRGEIGESISIVRQLLENMPDGEVRLKPSMFMKVPAGDAHLCVEAARGELGFHVVSDGTDKPYRVKVRGPSFSHALVAFPYLARGSQVADIPAIYWSLDPCPASMDR